jgi:periplasmic protein TonB
MAYAIASAEQLPFGRFFGYSVGLHAALIVLLFVGMWVEHSGNSWGGVGDEGESSMKVTLVPSAGIPMRQPTNITDSGVVDTSNTLHNPEPLPPPPEIKTPATELPKFEKEKPLPPTRPSKIFPKKTPDEDNAVPGHSGSSSIPTGINEAPGPLNGGVQARGVGGGDFAGRYPWYVQAVKRAISQNWMQNTIDPAVRTARTAKTTMTFSIGRDGTIKNIRMGQSSGNRSMDDSAQRALLSIDHFPPLPADYSGSYVDVTFDFDLGMTR